MMEICDLSVVIPNYNHGKFLRKCVFSVVNQSVQPQEIIIVEDCSTDDSLDICKQLEKEISNVKLLINDRNRGAVFTMNRGGNAATSKYLYFLAADDFALPGLIEQFDNAVFVNPNICLFKNAVRGYFYRGNGRVELKRGLYNNGWGAESRYFSVDEVSSLLAYGAEFFTSPIYLKEAWVDAGCLVEEFGPIADWFCNIVVLARYGVFHCVDELLERHYYCESYYNSLAEDEKIQILEKILDLLYSSAYEDILPFCDKSSIFFRNFKGIVNEIFLEDNELIHSDALHWHQMISIRNLGIRLHKLEDKMRS